MFVKGLRWGHTEDIPDGPSFYAEMLFENHGEMYYVMTSLCDVFETIIVSRGSFFQKMRRMEYADILPEDPSLLFRLDLFWRDVKTAGESQKMLDGAAYPDEIRLCRHALDSLTWDDSDDTSARFLSGFAGRDIRTLSIPEPSYSIPEDALG